MAGFENLYRIRTGSYRIIFSLNDSGEISIASVETIGSRGDVYKQY